MTLTIVKYILMKQTSFIIQHKKYLLTLYFLTHFTYGITFNVLGPALPILAEHLSQPQQNLVFLVTIRGVAYAIAALLYKKQSISSIDQHILLIGSTSILGISSLLFEASSSLLLLGIVMFSFALCACSIQIMVNTCVVRLCGEQSSYWVSLIYGVYGLGSIVGPLSIAFFGIFVFTIMGIQMLVICSLYCWLQFMKSNEFKNQELLQKLNPECNPQQKTLTYNQKIQAHHQQRKASKQVHKAFMLAGLFYSAMAQSYRIWISTFCLQTHIGAPQFGTYLTSLHIGFMTLFRFLVVFMTINNQKVLFNSLKAIFVAMILSLTCFLLEFEFQTVLLITFAIILGILFSNLFPLILSLPRLYNFQLGSSLMSDLMIGTAIGQTLIAAMVGYLMFFIHPLTLYLAVGFFAVIVYKALKYLTGKLLDCSQEFENIQLNQIKKEEQKQTNYEQQTYEIVIKKAQKKQNQVQNNMAQRAQGDSIFAAMLLDTRSNANSNSNRQSTLSNRSSKLPIQFSQFPRNQRLSFASK